MAIDSASKRASAMNISCPWRSSLPLPDGTIDQGDRQHAAFMYSGILAGIPQADPIVDTGTYARIGFSEGTYNRQGHSESTYNRTGASEQTYARP